MKNIGLRLNALYGSMNALYWMSYGVYMTFSSVFLLAKGYTNSDIGVILALGNVFAVIIQPLIADAADRGKKLDLFGVTELCTVLLIVLSSLFFVFKGKSLALTIVFIALTSWNIAVQPLLNAFARKLEESGHHINFGICRSMGSLFYALFCAVFGAVVEATGVFMIPLTGDLIVALLLVSLVLEKKSFDRAKAENKASRELSKGEDALEGAEYEEITLSEFIKRNRLFFVLCIGVCGVFISNSITNNFMLQIVNDVGGDSTKMGILAGIMAGLEVPTLMVYEQIRKRFALKPLIVFSAFCFVIKHGLIFIAPNFTVLCLAHLFQPLSFALFTPAMVEFIGAIMEKGEAVKGQALYSASGGFIIDTLGVKALVLIGCIFTLCGAVIIKLTLGRIGKK